MRIPIAVLAASLLSTVPVTAPGQQTAPAPTPSPAEPPLRIAASSFATVEVHLNAWRIGRRWYEEDAALTGPSRIAISYGQPHARGRQIAGKLIPLDTVWRFGANTATALHTDVDITIGNLKIPRGDYTLFMLYRTSGWQLIVNRATAMWGTDYDASKDLGRIPLTVRTMAEPQESLTMYLVPDSARPADGYADLSGVLRIEWGTFELSTRWTVER